MTRFIRGPSDRRGRKNPSVLRRGVPVDGVDMKERQDPVQDTVVSRQQAVDDVAHNNPGQEMREQNRGLGHPREPAGAELVEQYGQRHGASVPTMINRKLSFKVLKVTSQAGAKREELEIVKADPGGIEESRLEVELLKRNEHVRKREITEDQRIDGDRYDEQVGGSVRADFAQEAETAFHE